MQIQKAYLLGDFPDLDLGIWYYCEGESPEVISARLGAGSATPTTGQRLNNLTLPAASGLRRCTRESKLPLLMMQG